MENKNTETSINDKFAHLGISIVSDSTSNKFGTIVEIDKEINDVCQFCKYGANDIENMDACYSCYKSRKLTEYYR